MPAGNKTVTINGLASSTKYYLNINISNDLFNEITPVPSNTGYIITDSSGSGGGDPHIVTVTGESYDLAHEDGIYMLFNNMKETNNFRVLCECMHLTEKEIKQSAFENILLHDTTFITRIWIIYNNIECVEVCLNTLANTDNTNNNINNTNKNIILGDIYDDKFVLKKHYNEFKEKYYNINYNGISRNITIGDYKIKVSVDLGCADHRNDVVISGPDMSGCGAIISSKHGYALKKY